MITIETLFKCDNTDKDTIEFCKEMQLVIRGAVEDVSFVEGEVNSRACDVSVRVTPDHLLKPSLAISVNDDKKAVYCLATLEEDNFLLEVADNVCTVLMHINCGEVQHSTSSRDIGVEDDQGNRAETYYDILAGGERNNLATFTY